MLFHFDLFETHKGRTFFTLAVSMILGTIALVAAFVYRLEFDGIAITSPYPDGDGAVVLFYAVYTSAVLLPLIPMWVFLEDWRENNPAKYKIESWLPLTLERSS